MCNSIQKKEKQERLLLRIFGWLKYLEKKISLICPRKRTYYLYSILCLKSLDTDLYKISPITNEMMNTTIKLNTFSILWYLFDIGILI